MHLAPVERTSLAISSNLFLSLSDTNSLVLIDVNVRLWQRP